MPTPHDKIYGTFPNTPRPIKQQHTETSTAPVVKIKIYGGHAEHRIPKIRHPYNTHSFRIKLATDGAEC